MNDYSQDSYIMCHWFDFLFQSNSHKLSCYLSFKSNFEMHISLVGGLVHLVCRLGAKPNAKNGQL